MGGGFAAAFLNDPATITGTRSDLIWLRAAGSRKTGPPLLSELMPPPRGQDALSPERERLREGEGRKESGIEPYLGRGKRKI